MTKTNETFKPVGLLEISKQIKSNLKKVDDLEERLHSALDAKRDVASNYVKQLDSIAEKEVEVKLDPFSDLLQTTIASNTAMWKAGYDEGFKAGSEQAEETINRELLESHGIDIDELVESVQETIKAHEKS